MIVQYCLEDFTHMKDSSHKISSELTCLGLGMSLAGLSGGDAVLQLSNPLEPETV